MIWPGSVTPIEPEWARSFPSVEGLFDVVYGAIRDGAERLDVEYDPTTGRPTLIDIDFWEGAVDDELRYESTALEPLPPSGS